MRRIVTFVLLLLINLSIGFAQSFPKVKLTFYLDATQSMETNDLWESSKDKLIQAIENIDDERTEITICVFADYCVKNTGKASNSDWRFEKISSNIKDGKNKLIDFVKGLKSPTESLPPNCSMTLTNLERPWLDFISKSKNENEDCINAMILITDGGHESKYFPQSHFFDIVRSWHSSTNNNSFGWVVELKDEVNDSEKKAKRTMDGLIDNQASLGRLKRTKKHDFNFKFLAIGQHPDTINIRASKSFNIKLSGNTHKANEYIKNVKFRCSNPNISFDDIKILSDGMTLQFTLKGIDPKTADVITPLEIEGYLPAEIEKNDLVTLLKSHSKFHIICKNEFSRALNITSGIKNKEHEIVFDNTESFEDIEYYESWTLLGKTISGDSIVPSQFRLKFHLNQDAIDRGSKPKLIFVDKNNKPLNKNLIKITDSNGNLIEEISVSDSSTYDFIVTFNPELYKEASISGYLCLVNANSLDFACGQEIQGGNLHNVLRWEVDIDHHYNPALVIFWWILFLLLCLLIAIILFYQLLWILGAKFPWNWDIKFESNINNNPTITFDCEGRDYRLNGFRIFTDNANTFYCRRLYLFRINKVVLCDQTKKTWNYFKGNTIYIKTNFQCDNLPVKINRIIISPSKGALAVVKIKFSDNTTQTGTLYHKNNVYQTNRISINHRNVDVFGIKHHKSNNNN